MAAGVSRSGTCSMPSGMGAVPLHSNQTPTITQERIRITKCTRAGGSLSHKKDGSFRFVSLNVNGFAKADPVGAILSAIDRCASAKTDYVGFSETNVDTFNPKFRVNLKHCVADRFPNCKVESSSTRILAPDVQKFGGTLSVAYRNVCSRLTTTYTDPSGLGRFNVMLMRGNGKRGIAVVTVYAAAANTDGPLTFASQQRIVLRMKGDDPEQNLRQRLWQDLRKEVEKVLKSGYLPIVLGDFNESIYTDNGELRKFMRDANLFDPMNCDIDTRDMGTHARGSKRIDYILVSKDLQPAVTSYGITDLDELIASDHRAVFCDIDFEHALGVNFPILLSPKGRSVQSKNISQSIRFLAKFDSIMKARDVHRRCNDLLNSVADSGPTPTASRKMRGVDKDLRDALICAERTSGRAYAPPWSKDLHSAFLECRFWSIYCRRSDDLASSRIILLSISTELGWPTLPVVDETEARKLRREAQRRAKKIREKAESHRENMLEEELNKATDLNDDQKAKAIRAISRCEATRRSFLKIRFATKGIQSGALTAVQQQEEDGSVTTTTDPDKMIPLLLEAGRRHFSQAEGTPFTTKPLADMEYTGACLQADAILRGCSSFTLDRRIPDSTRQWIEHARHLDSGLNPDEISSWITPKEAREGYTKWKEATSTSPHGDHLSIYKVLAKDMSRVDVKRCPANCRSLDKIQNEAWDCIAAIMTLGTHFGLTIPRWEKAVCTMIEKSPGNFLLHKLRRIFLFASDYNLSLGILVGRRLVWHAEDKGRIHPDLWGSRSGRSAPDAALMKELTYDAARLTNTPLATFDNDAKSCYDRIVMLVAALIARRAGLPKTTAKWMNETLHCMKCMVKTALGVSEEYFGTTDGSGNTKHGPGQGHRAAPALWLLISSFLFDQMDRLAKGVSFNCPEDVIHHARKMDGYVDDVSSFFNMFRLSLRGGQIDPKDMAHGMQNDASHWATQLNISGGALELSKCFWYLMFPVPGKDNHMRLMSKEELVSAGANIDLECPQTGTNQSIILKEVNEGHRTLGFHKCINGSQSLQIEVLREKSSNFASAIRRLYLTREESVMAAEHILCPKLSYPLSSSALSNKECHFIHSPGLSECIRGAGYCKSAPRAMIHGQLSLGGASFTNMYASQTWSIFDALRHHLTENKETARLIRICLSWTQLNSGVGFRIFENCSVPIKFCKKSTILTLRDGLAKCAASWRIHEAPFFPTLRENDRHLMDLAMEYSKQTETLKDINSCRLFLGVITVSDIASTCGRHIMRGCYICSQAKFRNSNLFWPRIPTPNLRQLKRWRRFLITSLLKPYKKERRIKADPKRKDLQLREPLGRWTKPPLTRQHFDCMLGNGMEWNYVKKKGFYQHATGTLNPKEIPRTWLPFERLDHDIHSRTSSMPDLPKRIVEPGSLRYKEPIISYVLPSLNISSYAFEWEKEFLENLETKEDGLTAIVGQHSLIFASDGGADGPVGGFGTVIATPYGRILATNYGQVSGLSPSSFRAEAFGFLSNAILYRLLRQKETTVHANFLIDNEGIIKVVRKALEQPHIRICRNQNELDLVLSIIHILHPFRKEVTITHVKGHQDKEKHFDKLDFHAQLNVRSDALATKGMTDARPMPITSLLPFSASTLTIRGVDITGNWRRSILDASTYREMKEYVKTKHNITETTFNQIDWESLGSAMKGFSVNQRATIVKFAHNHLPLGKRIDRRKKGEPASCQCCLNGTIETDWHLLRCDKHDTWRKRAQTAILKRLKELETSPHLISSVMNSLFVGLDDKYTRDTGGMRPLETAVLQDDIWRGRIPTAWSEMHKKDRPMRRKKETKEGKQWARHVITTIFHQFFQLWHTRNKNRHGENEESAATIERGKILKRTIKVQQRAARITRKRDRVFFFAAGERLDNKHTTTLRSYLSWAEPLLERCLADQTHQTTPKPPPAPNVPLNRVRATMPNPSCTQKAQPTLTGRPLAATPGLPTLPAIRLV